MDYRQKLNEFYSSPAAQKTVGELIKELKTSTSNVLLPTMIQARAILELTQKYDLRKLCKKTTVPKGAGKTAKVQLMTQPDYDDWTEGSALSAADPSLASKSATISPFGKVTKITDLLANTSAIDFVSEVGRVHGASVRQGAFDKIVDAMAGASSRKTVTLGSGGGGTEQDFTLANVATAKNAITDANPWEPDFIITAPDKAWNAFTSDYSVTQFTGALADILKTGGIPRIFGLEWYTDPYFETAVNAGAYDGSDGEVYAIIGQKGVSGIWAAMQQDPVVEVYRKGTELSNYIVTHIDGGAVEGVDESICTIEHASA